MLNKYGKAAVVAAIAGSCGYVSAATISATASAPGTTVVSLEGAATTANAATQIALGTISMTMGETYFAQDRIELVLSGANAKFASYGPTGVTPSVTCSGTDFLLESSLSSPGNTASFTIYQKSAGVTSIGKVCSFASLSVSASSLTSAGDVTVSSRRVSSGVNSDSGVAASSGANKLFSAGSQIVAITVLSTLNGVVDFQNSLGLGFATDDGVTAGVTGKGDAFTLELTSRDTFLSTTGNFSLTFAISAASGKTFSFLDDGGACGTSAELNRTTSNGRVAASAGNVTINAACSVITYSNASVANLTGTAQTIKLEFGHKSTTPSTGVVIEPMVFPSFDATISQGATARATGTALLPGSWTSNGSTVQIPYMPVNSTAGAGKIDPVIIISNRSTATGTITATLRDEAGNTCALTDAQLGTIAGNRTKSIGGLIRDAADGSSCPTLNVAGGERLSITLNVTLPSGSTEVYSGYTVGGADRVTVVNSSNGVPNP